MATCKVCKKTDLVKDPVIRNDVTRFIDESGRIWNGLVCPSCYKLYNKARMKATRQKQIEVCSPKPE